MMETGRMTKRMDMESTTVLMGLHMRGYGRTIRLMVKVR